MNRPLRFRDGWAGCIACALTLTSEAGAQPVEEIVVTATKRGSERVQDIPMSIQAITGDQLEARGALDFEDYYRQVPGLSVNNQGPGDKRYIIRGINSPGHGTVGLYFDEVIVTGTNIDTEGGRQPDIKLFDMNRIEVLKGPQGTTFGSSSLSGAVRWIPKYPDLEQYSAEVGAGFLSTRHSDGLGWTVDGMANLPLISDRLALRLSGIKVDKKGYIDNRFRKDANDDDTEAVRGILSWQLSDSAVLSLLAMHQHSLTHGRPGYMDRQIDLPNSPSLNGGPVPEFFNTDLSDGLFDDKIDIYNAKLEFTRDWGTITATTSRFERDTEFDRDASAEIEIITGGAFPADGAGQSFIRQPQDREVTTTEIRFASDWSGPYQLLLGGFLQKEERDFRSTVVTVDPVTGKTTPDSFTLLDRTVFTQIDEVAVFGELSWELTDALTLTGGVRWFEFEFEENAAALTGFPGVPGSGPGPRLTSDESDVIFKLNLSYNLSDDLLTFFQFAQGYRSGGTNDQTAASIAGVTIPPGFGSDSIDNYEVGIKGSWLDNRLDVAASAYFISWTDIQVGQQATAPSGLTFAYRGNGGEAEVRGLELEVQAYPTPSTQVGLTVNYTDAELTEDLPIPTDGLKGDELPYVPEITASVNGRYERQVGSSGWIGFVSGDWSYVGSQVNRLRPTDIQYREIGSYSILNLRAGLEGDDWSVILGLDNVFDEDEIVSYTFNGGSQPAVGFVPPSMVRPWPRTVSLTARKTFDF